MSKPSENASIFEHVPENRLVNYVNSLFSDMFEVWKQLPSQDRLEVFGLFTSHGIRRPSQVHEASDNGLRGITRAAYNPLNPATLSSEPDHLPAGSLVPFR